MEPTKRIKELLEALKVANEKKDTKEAKKLRRTLRGEGWYISKGGFTEEPKEGEAKTKKTKKEEKKEEPKKEPEDEGKMDDEELRDIWHERIMKATRPDEVFGRDVNQRKKEWRRLCKLFHPDLSEGYEEVMKKINELWSKVAR